MRWSHVLAITIFLVYHSNNGISWLLRKSYKLLVLFLKLPKFHSLTLTATDDDIERSNNERHEGAASFWRTIQGSDEDALREDNPLHNRSVQYN